MKTYWAIALTLVVLGALSTEYFAPELAALGDVFTDNAWTKPLADRYTSDSTFLIRLWQHFDWFFSLAPYAFLMGLSSSACLPLSFNRVLIYLWVGIAVAHSAIVAWGAIYHDLVPWNSLLSGYAVGAWCQVAVFQIGINTWDIKRVRPSILSMLLLTGAFGLLFMAANSSSSLLGVLAYLLLFATLAIFFGPHVSSGRRIPATAVTAGSI